MDARSYLFVPANRPQRIAKALASGADAVVLDLEDAVAPDTKAAARQVIAQWAATAGDDARARIVVRCNDAAGSHVAQDLRLLREARLMADFAWARRMLRRGGH